MLPEKAEALVEHSVVPEMRVGLEEQQEVVMMVVELAAMVGPQQQVVGVMTT